MKKRWFPLRDKDPFVSDAVRCWLQRDISLAGTR